jgi:hypothetical protein
VLCWQRRPAAGVDVGEVGLWQCDRRGVPGVDGLQGALCCSVQDQSQVHGLGVRDGCCNTLGVHVHGVACLQGGLYGSVQGQSQRSWSKSLAIAATSGVRDVTHPLVNPPTYPEPNWLTTMNSVTTLMTSHTGTRTAICLGYVGVACLQWCTAESVAAYTRNVLGVSKVAYHCSEVCIVHLVQVTLRHPCLEVQQHIINRVHTSFLERCCDGAGLVGRAFYPVPSVFGHDLWWQR